MHIENFDYIGITQFRGDVVCCLALSIHSVHVDTLLDEELDYFVPRVQNNTTGSLSLHALAQNSHMQGCLPLGVLYVYRHAMVDKLGDDLNRILKRCP
jgi:hypothetical protein